ncbi:hypothetical protein BS50DRAFT_580242 [Corynespora cassiicola Philippines]|uniref:Uncharacterized protein n=1 Tax=Corynespora cassiicola Philippines TaxID=1448308 RepID=A0A2T2N0X1_CORCC|nr:hypothetical protein BS50DRAFT_580242 [Corynespora cassiicola Philippines]
MAEIRQSNDCDPALGDSSSGYVPFYVNIASVAIFWWAAPIIFNLKKPFCIPKAIVWSTIRACQPGLVAVVAIRSSLNHNERINYYYNGSPVHGASEHGIGWGGTLFHLIFDALTIYPAASLWSDRKLCDDTTWQSIAPSYWFYPTVPSALMGIYIIFTSNFILLGKKATEMSMYIVVIAVGIGLFLYPILISDDTTKALKIFPSFVAYMFMTQCLALRPSSSRKHDKYVTFHYGFWAGLYSTFARALPIFVSIWIDGLYKLPPWAQGNRIFALVYLSVGILCAFIHCCGLFMKGNPKEHYNKRKEENSATSVLV